MRYHVDAGVQNIEPRDFEKLRRGDIPNRSFAGVAMIAYSHIITIQLGALGAIWLRFQVSRCLIRALLAIFSDSKLYFKWPKSPYSPSVGSELPEVLENTVRAVSEPNSQVKLRHSETIATKEVDIAQDSDLAVGDYQITCRPQSISSDPGLAPKLSTPI